MQQHLIYKQTIELGLSHKAEAFQMQQMVSDHFRHDILPILEQAFDEFSDEAETLKIPHLEIDLGRLSIKEMRQDHWQADILLRLKEQLQKKIIKIANDKKSRRITNILNKCSQWLLYMQKGYLPWNTLKPDTSWYGTILEGFVADSGMIVKLRDLLSKNTDIIKRIIWQHDTHFLKKLIAALTGKSQDLLPVAVTELQKILSQIYTFTDISLTTIELRHAIWEHILTIVVEEQVVSPSWQDLIEKVTLYYLSDLAVLKKTIAKNASMLPTIFPILLRLCKEPDKFPTTRSTRYINKIFAKNDNRAAMEKMSSTFLPPNEELFVRHAGIVLIHVFLPELFKRLGWVHEGNFINKRARQKALHLLHYMATGHIKPDEHDLTIAKILCAWPISMSVEKEIYLKPAAIKESENMITAAIEKWTVLKNTSISGLREGFFHRKGKLYTKNEHPCLQIEHNSIDLLLDQLPWNLSIVKLPWMRNILRVEWR